MIIPQSWPMDLILHILTTWLSFIKLWVISNLRDLARMDFTLKFATVLEIPITALPHLPSVVLVHNNFHKD